MNSGKGKMKIMIVDDSETLRAQLRRDLESKQYQVIEGVDGMNGLDLLAANPDVKLIISDVNMPRLDGLSMTKKIHDDEKYKTIPVIIMTTEMSADLKAKGKDAGVRAWITKPYVAEKLLAAIGKIIA
jgi:two-component system, chemotaxis family, chemotaxis protein CheY